MSNAPATDTANHHSQAHLTSAATVWSRRYPLAVLITVEGLDGSGKTTLINGLKEHLNATVLREPGGVALSERIRDLVQDPALEVDPRAEALLYAAARAQLVADEAPAAPDSRAPPSSSTASSTRHSPTRAAAASSASKRSGALNEFGTQGLTPDLTLYLRIDPQQGLARIAGREQDRLEGAGLEFFERVAKHLRRAGRRTTSSIDAEAATRRRPPSRR